MAFPLLLFAREMARAPPPQNKNKNGRSDSAAAAAASCFGGVSYHYMPEKRGGNNKSASVSRCMTTTRLKFNCSEPSKKNPNRPCGKGCCNHRNPNNRKKFMKRRSCKSVKRMGKADKTCAICTMWINGRARFARRDARNTER